MKSLRLFCIFSMLILLGYQKSTASVLTVSSANDTGPGTLREAITTLASPGDVITFSGPMTINLASSILINKTDLLIDATTMTGWSASANKVTIAGTIASAFTTQTSPAPATNLRIKGLIFSGFTTSCISLQDVSNFSITNCWFGLLANGISSSATTGLCITIKGTSSYGNIGTGNPSDRNIFFTTGSATTCINLTNTGVSNTQLIKIQGNYFGTNYSGTAVPSGSSGLGGNSAIKSSNSGYVLIGGSGPNEGNLIEGCSSGSAIVFTGTSNFEFTIQGNKFGSVSPNSKCILFGSTNDTYTIIGNTFLNSSSVAIDMTPSTYTNLIKISQNSFSNNSGGGINTSSTPPTINSATPTMIKGSGAGPNSTVEIYNWDGLTTVGQGTSYLATVTADAAGNWQFQGPFTVNQKLVALAITPATSAPSGTTTKFSSPFTVVACPSAVNAGVDQNICTSSSYANLNGSTVSATAPMWTIISGSGTLTNPTSLTPTYNLSAAEQNFTGPGVMTVALKLTVTTATCDPTISDDIVITINPKPIVNAGGNTTVCADVSTISLNGTVTNATGGIWSGGAGSYTPNAPISSYAPTAAERVAGTVNLTLTSTGNGVCNAYTSTKTITITPAPTINAGSDQTICANATNVAINGTVTVATGGHWTTSGTGTFANPNALNTNYTPSAADKSAASVTLTLTSTGNGICNAVSDQMVVTITKLPSSNAGPDQTVCQTSSTVNLNGSINNASGGSWSTIGSGTFTPNTTTLTASYTPSTADKTAGYVGLKLTTTGNGACPAFIDTVIITLAPAATINAGPDQTTCNNIAAAMLSASVTVATGGTWTTSGSGTFGNPNSLNTYYTPSAADKSSASVTLTITSTGNGSCNPATDQMVIYFNQLPVVNAGPDQTICANTTTVSLTASVSGATGGNWTTNGSGTFANPNSINTTYTPSASDYSITSVSLTLISTGNGACTAVSDKMIINFIKPAFVDAGPDQNVCMPVSSITLAGSTSNGGNLLWKANGMGDFSSATTLNTNYIPSSSELNTSSPLTINITLETMGNAPCPAVIDQMTLTFSPKPIVSAGMDQTICAINPNTTVSGNIIGANGGVWKTSGTGMFANADQLSTTYTPSTADKANGSVTLTLNSNNGTCGTASDYMLLTINPCLIDPQLAFESPTLFKNNESAPFKHNLTAINSTGAITYSIKKFSTSGPTSCATIDANGYVTATCVDTILVTAIQAQKNPYLGDTATYKLYIGKAVTQITLESHGGTLGGAPFSLSVKTNTNQALSYSIIGGDVTAATITPDGIITPSPTQVGTVYIVATASANANYQAGTSNMVAVTIYPNLTKPVAVNDTIITMIGEEQSIDIGKNDYGTTASIILSTGMVLDIDAENSGVQKKYFRPGVGTFLVDSLGILTFSPFVAYIGIDSLLYTITDANGMVSKTASVVFYVNPPSDEIEMKANEIITANNDNINDALVIGYTDLTQRNDLLVVDAAGNKLYYTVNYQNNWGGIDSNGKELGNGVYYFVFREYNPDGKQKRQLKGNFTIIR